VVQERLNPALGTLANLLGAAGYYAAYKGKWHLNIDLENGTPQNLASRRTNRQRSSARGREAT